MFPYLSLWRSKEVSGINGISNFKKSFHRGLYIIGYPTGYSVSGMPYSLVLAICLILAFLLIQISSCLSPPSVDLISKRVDLHLQMYNIKAIHRSKPMPLYESRQNHSISAAFTGYCVPLLSRKQSPLYLRKTTKVRELRLFPIRSLWMSRAISIHSLTNT